LPLLLAAVGAGLVLLAATTSSLGEAADRPHRRFVPGLAADSARAPTPVPTPFPAPIYDTDRRITMFFEIDAKELAVSGTGFTIVHISANVSAPLPTADQPVVTASGTFTIAPHPGDAVGCTWTRTLTKDTFKVTLFQTTDLSIVANLEAPEWYYIMTCPTDGGRTPPLRFPAFGEEGMFYFLQELMAPYRQGLGVKLPMDVVSEFPISCIKRHGLFQQGPTNFTDGASVEVFVYQPDFPGGCLLTPSP
jgi:hypothetical protein